ncbi:MAG: LacI family DNA-binding transcriptional regulator [Actinomycetes bacterium]|jgi:DNA-binding LacI/PurR family transcriptional regulator
MKEPRNRLRRAPTILDVAEAAGVSKSVVSRALRGEAKVSKEAAAAVQKAIKQLRYQPNFVARSLKERISPVIGVVTGDLRNPYYVDILDGVYSSADKQKYKVIVASGHGVPGGEEAAIRSLIEFRVAGLILASPNLEMKEIQALAGDLPVAIEGRHDALEKFDVVTSDDRLGGQMAIEHLVNFGHKKILILTDSSPGSSERQKGFDAAIRSAGITKSVLRRKCEPTTDGGHSAIELILRENIAFTAVVCSNDVTACGVLAALSEEGLRVPRDISVTGFDDIDLVSMRQFDLTTIRQDRTEIGKLAFDAVYKRANSVTKIKSKRTILEPRLIIRGSSGQAKN